MAQKVTSKMQVCCCGCVGIAKGVGGINVVGRKTPSKQKRGIMVKQARAHMIRFNRNGMARTQDYVMYDPSQSMVIPGRAKVRGSGAWKNGLSKVCAELPLQRLTGPRDQSSRATAEAQHR